MQAHASAPVLNDFGILDLRGIIEVSLQSTPISGVSSPDDIPSASPFRPWVLGAVYFLVISLLAREPRLCGNVWSRYSTIESIVERGTLRIDESPFRGASSPDVARFGDHFYSDKPPVLPAVAAVVYWGLTRLGLRLTGPADQGEVVNWVLVISLVGTCSTMGLVWLRKLFDLVRIPAWQADLHTLFCGFGTLLLPYTLTFNNHAVAAGLLTGAIYFVFGREPSVGLRRHPGPLESDREPAQPADRSGGSPWRNVAAGCLAGAALVTDIPAGGATLVALGVYLAARKDLRSARQFVLGSLPFVGLHCVLQTMVTGSPLPAELYPEAFDDLSPFRVGSEETWREPGSRWPFLLEFLVGPAGWLTVTPILPYSFVGLCLPLFTRRDPLRPAATVAAAVICVLIVYYVWGVRRTDFAGRSFGTRHLVPIVPFCYFFAVVALRRLRAIIWRATFVLLGLVSLIYAYEGARDPWERIEMRVAQGSPNLAVLQRLVVYPWSRYNR